MAYRLKNIRVLVIDPNHTIRNLIRSLLLDLGFHFVDMAENINDGWRLYCEHQPDVMLLDWRFNNDDTLDFIRRIRLSRQGPDAGIPIILMTAYTNKELLFKARDAGITEFLIKPFTIETLTRQFAQLIEKPRDFVMSKNFTGPDRRRRHAAIEDVGKKRKADNGKTVKEDA